jgi:hypothetical protein
VIQVPAHGVRNPRAPERYGPNRSSRYACPGPRPRTCATEPWAWIGGQGALQAEAEAPVHEFPEETAAEGGLVVDLETVRQLRRGTGSHPGATKNQRSRNAEARSRAEANRPDVTCL